MKKNITLLTFLLCSLTSWAQIPAGYYSTAIGTGLTLKTQLKKIIDDVNDGLASEHLHADQGYPALWTLFTHSAFRDNYYENDGSLLDMYSENPTGTDPYNFTWGADECGNYNSEGDCYNKEHVIPQSVFNEDFNENFAPTDHNYGASLVPEVGDIILYQEGYYEVDNIVSNQYFMGKNPDYPNQPGNWNPDLDQFGYNVSVICETHYIPGDKVGITRERFI